jgi:DNA (cytosine-5)-methyltransferase 1
MTAYYNEIDPYAAQWLRNLIKAGHIASGFVDETDIRDVQPSTLMGYTQCHFFAGIGVWSHALRRAGWPDDRPIWTGSCPCQPFSAAGTGAGFADERHLWPHFHWLIEQCNPSVVLGEQVASKDGLQWLDLVSADLEGSGYAVAAGDLCAAGFGGAHIRQRLYWFATHSEYVGMPRPSHINGSQGRQSAESIRSPVSGVGNAESVRGINTDPGAMGGTQCKEYSKAWERDGQADRIASPVSGLADHKLQQRPHGEGRECPEHEAVGRVQNTATSTGFCSDLRASAPMLGRNPADWLYCRDGKWRPVEPGTFPLAHAAPSRVGRLRAYGNGLDAETATQFITAVMES